MVSSIAPTGVSLNRLIAASGGAAVLGEVSQARSRPSPAAPAETTPVAGAGKTELSEAERREIERLERRDREVPSHERAHRAAAGQYPVAGPDNEYETGPNGRRYAVGGEVQVDTSAAERNPEATLRKMQQIKRAAQAPSRPSSQDRAVAARAAREERTAQAHKTKKTDPAEAHTPPASTAAAARDTASGPQTVGSVPLPGRFGEPVLEKGRFIDALA